MQISTLSANSIQHIIFYERDLMMDSTGKQIIPKSCCWEMRMLRGSLQADSACKWVREQTRKRQLVQPHQATPHLAA